MDPLLSLDLNMITALGCAQSWNPKLDYPDSPNVLRNVSTGEFLREDGLFVVESDWWCVSLAHAQLSRICYLPDARTSSTFRQ